MAILVVVTALVTTGAVFFVMLRGPAPQEPKHDAITASPKAHWIASECEPSLARAALALAEKRRAVCGHVRAPETKNSRRSVEIAVVRLILENPTKVPLLFVAGGPGDAFSYKLEERLKYFTPLAAGREIVVIDQRGTGQSRPLLECTSTPKSQADLARCFTEWSADVDLGSFNTIQSAADLALVLENQELEKVAVYGVSYGTHLALTFAQDYPARVEALLLDSPISRKQDVLAQAAEMAQAGFQKIVAACRDNEACARRFEISLESISEVALQMNERSADSGTDWVYALSKLSLSPKVPGLVPLLVEQAKSGDVSLMNKLREGFSGYSSSLGLHLSIQCAEFLATTSVAKIKARETAVKEPFREAFSALAYGEQCRTWRVPAEPPPQIRERLTVPTLILSGAHDPVTPPEYGQEVLQELAEGHQIVIQSVSHAAALSDCGAQVGALFFDEGLLALRGRLPACVGAPLGFFESPPDAEQVAQMVHDIRYRL